MMMLHCFWAQDLRYGLAAQGSLGAGASGQDGENFQLLPNSSALPTTDRLRVVKSLPALSSKFPHSPQTRPCRRGTAAPGAQGTAPSPAWRGGAQGSALRTCRRTGRTVGPVVSRHGDARELECVLTRTLPIGRFGLNTPVPEVSAGSGLALAVSGLSAARRPPQGQISEEGL